MGKSSDLSTFRGVACLLAVFLWLLPTPIARAQSSNTPLVLPTSVAYDATGNLYFVETGSHLVRRLTPSGTLTIVAGTGTQGFAGDSGPASAALLDSPTALALDAAGDLFVADTHNHRIRRVDAETGIISTYALVSLPVALTFNQQGSLVYADAGTHQVLTLDNASGQPRVLAGNGVQGFAGDGSAASAASIDTPSGLAFDPAGNLFLADAHNHRIRRVDAATGIITTIAGTGQPGFSGDQAPAAAAQLDLPRGLSFDSAGNLFLADSRNQRIRRVDAVTGAITTVAGNGTQAFLGDGGPAVNGSLDTPRGITISPTGSPTLADSGNNRVRQVDANANLQTIAGTGAISPARTASATALMQASPNALTTLVSAASGTATGTVTLIDGTSPLTSAPLAAGSATFATSLLSAGSHTLTASYSGSSVLMPSTSPPLIVTIGSATAADFTLVASAPTSVQTVPGSAATFTFALGLTGAALTSPIELAVSGIPAGATASFSPAVVPPPSGPVTFTLTIDTPASASVEMPNTTKPAVLLLASLLLLPFTRRRSRHSIALLGLLLLAGCGARVNTGNSTVAPPISYNVVVSAAATSPSGASLLHTAQVTLIVQ